LAGKVYYLITSILSVYEGKNLHGNCGDKHASPLLAISSTWLLYR